jgi:DNA-binding transcriptional ArsR family regulator
MAHSPEPEPSVGKIDQAFLDAAAHPQRLAILFACSERPQTVADLDLPADLAASHLRVLEDAGIIALRGDAYVARADWRPLVTALEALASQHTGARDRAPG